MKGIKNPFAYKRTGERPVFIYLCLEYTHSIQAIKAL